MHIVSKCLKNRSMLYCFAQSLQTEHQFLIFISDMDYKIEIEIVYFNVGLNTQSSVKRLFLKYYPDFCDYHNRAKDCCYEIKVHKWVQCMCRHDVTIYESRARVGGKVASWKDKDGNHIEVTW